MDMVENIQILLSAAVQFVENVVVYGAATVGGGGLGLFLLYRGAKFLRII